MPFLARTPVVAALAAIAALAAALELSERDVASWQVAGAAFLAAAAMLALPRRPVLALVALPVALVVATLGDGDQSPGALVLAMLLAIYRIGEREDRRTGLLALAWVVGSGQVATIASGEWYPGDILFAGTVFSLPWLLGHSVASGRAAQAELEARTAELEAERRRRASFEVARERERLAARVNGVVNDALRGMVDGAGRGLHALPADRGAAADALAEIEDTGRKALREMRALLGVLREEPAPSPGVPAPELDPPAAEAAA